MTSVSQVIIVGKSHFDFGFTDFASNVEADFIDQYIPQAIDIGRALSDHVEPVGYNWTVGSWIMWQALERADATRLKVLENAILQRVIAWHALPFTMHSELCDESLFRFGLSLSDRLDHRFGLKTVAAKTSDVPGHSIGIVPLLAEAGVRFLHIGRNPCCRPPRVPALFRWRFQGSEVVVGYSHDYRGTVLAPDGSAALVIACRPDNVGPHSPGDWLQKVAHYRREYEFATVRAGRMDEFVPALEASLDLLPIIEEDIGDSWLYGGGSSPRKMARYRAMCRVRVAFEDQPDLCRSDQFDALSRSLLCVPEHTWGLNHATTLRDHFTDADGKVDRTSDRDDIERLERSWNEQMAFVDDALAAIEGTTLQRIAHEELKQLEVEVDLPSPEAVSLDHLHLQSARFFLEICSKTGAVIALSDRGTGRKIADTSHPLGVLRYKLSDKSDYVRYAENYVVGRHLHWVQFSIDELTRPGLKAESLKRGEWVPRLVGTETISESACILWLTFDEEDVATAPQNVRVRISLVDDRVCWTVDIINKLPTRFPESLYCSFAPVGAHFRAHTLGATLPSDRIANGGMGLHGVQRGVVSDSEGLRIWIESLDAPLVQIGDRDLLDIREPDDDQIASFNLFNNLWCTNFELWSEGSFRFRFSLKMDAK